jgi:uncharacterized protein YjgD (DUF1641 family)
MKSMEKQQVTIEELNEKVDLILEYVNQQRLKSETVSDLVEDVSIVGKDIYDSTVKALDDQNVEIQPDEFRDLGIRLLRNVRTFNTLLETMESLTDLAKDAAPIANEVIIDATARLHEFETKGYFDFIREAGTIIDNIVTHFSVEDIRLLSDNIVTIMETVKNLTQPEMLQSVNNAVKIFASMDIDRAPEYSVWKLMREMGTPEMKKSLGFFVMFMKNLNNNTKNNQ